MRWRIGHRGRAPLRVFLQFASSCVLLLLSAHRLHPAALVLSDSYIERLVPWHRQAQLPLIICTELSWMKNIGRSASFTGEFSWVCPSTSNLSSLFSSFAPSLQLGPHADNLRRHLRWNVLASRASRSFCSPLRLNKSAPYSVELTVVGARYQNSTETPHSQNGGGSQFAWHDPANRLLCHRNKDRWLQHMMQSATPMPRQFIEREAFNSTI